MKTRPLIYLSGCIYFTECKLSPEQEWLNAKHLIRSKKK